MLDYDVLYQGDWVRIISPHGYPYECLGEGDGVLVLPIKDGKLGIRKELCPPYLVMDTTGELKYYTLITGGVEEDESFEDGALRELFEEAGISLIDYEMTEFPPIPIFKNLANRMHIFVCTIAEAEESAPQGDGTAYEAECETIWLTKQEITDIILNNQNYDMLFLLAYFMIGSGVLI